MTVPQRLADRLLVVSRDDYVYVVDENPELLKDHRVTIVPVPLVGRWMEFPELRDADLSVGAALVRDPDDPGRYVPAEDALLTVAKAKRQLINTVCHHLGATSLKDRQLDSRSGENTLKNTFHAGATAGISSSHRKGTDKIDHERSFSADLASKIRSALHIELETKGYWQGGEPNIEAARNVISGHEKTVGNEIIELIDMRASPHNKMTYHSVTIDSFGELHRHFSLLAEIAIQFKSSLGRESASTSTRMSNTFEWNEVVTQQGKLMIEVWFVDPPTQLDRER